MKELMAGGTWRTSGLALLFGCFFLIALWELYAPRRALDNPVGHRWLGNLVVYCINAALLVWVFPAPSETAARIGTSLGLGLPQWPEMHPIADFAIGFLFLDFIRYWFHRLFHSVPWLWRLHSLHHADSDLDVSTSLRHHPVEYVVGSGLFWLVFVITGFPPVVAGAYLLCTSTLSCFQHGNIRLPQSWEGLLQKVLVTPDMHRLHHSVVVAEANSNFGFLLSFWDRLFATFRQIPQAAHNRMQFGLMEIRNPSFPLMLLLPLRLRRSVAYPK
jgi:sterol desaturase/sphingolipid hydroxylase (fatty acid hydroxylase superfamily)